MEKDIYQVEQIKKDLREAQRERNVGLAKTVGWSAVPLLSLAGIGGLCGLATLPIENHDLKYLVSMGMGLGLGGFVGASGMVRDWYEQLKDLWVDIKYSNERVGYLRNQKEGLESVQ